MTSPFNLHSLLRNYLKLFGEDSCVLIYTSSHSQNVSKLLTEMLLKYSKPRIFQGGGTLHPWGPLQGLCPGPTGALKRSPDSSPTFVPPNTKSWIRPCILSIHYYSVTTVKIHQVFVRQ